MPNKEGHRRLCQGRQLRVRHRRPERGDAEVHRRRQDLEHDVAHQPRLPRQRRGQRAAAAEAGPQPLRVQRKHSVTGSKE
jgi:hypothetical protein